MKKWLVSLLFFLILLISHTNQSFAQAGFNPEFLGNAAGADRPGFCLKFFTSYYYQERISAHDVEVAFEPQLFIPGFSGDISKDQIQFVAHLPIGYRKESNDSGYTSRVTGIGTLNFNVEHFWHLMDTDETQLWLDNALTFGFPTATYNQLERIGADSYSVGWFTESNFRHDRFLISLMPALIMWSFRDELTKEQDGLSINVMNGSLGYDISSKVSLGINFGLQLSRIAGGEDGAHNSLPLRYRAYAGPAALIVFTPDLSLQVSGVIDIATKEINRGQGIFTALWHHF